MVKSILIHAVTAFSTLTILYLFLKVIQIEDQHLVQPGWHTTVITGKPLLMFSLISLLIITLISNLIFSIISRVMNEDRSTKEMTDKLG